ncbi:MAG TPA: hypothetical protein VJ723_00965 [Candidatus Angelobacter sp.]|nr:hypothetical protein [Candidatus Angelobacter sp.]
MATTKRIIEVYRALGRVLNDPAAFGLAQRAPKALVEELTMSRRKLMEELLEQKNWLADDDIFLETELSQDADLYLALGRT